MMIVQAKNDKLSLLKWEMLTSVLKALVKNLIKKSFYEKRKKKLMIRQFFSFPIKVMSKLSLTGLLTSVLRALISIAFLKLV